MAHVEEHGPARPAKNLLRFLETYRPDLFTVVLYASVVGLLTLVTPVAVQSVVNTTAFGTLLQPLFVLVVLLLVGLVLSGVLKALKSWSVEVLQRRMFLDAVARLAYLAPRVDWERARGPQGEHVVHRYYDLFQAQKGVASLLLGATDVLLAAGVGLLVLAFYHPLLLAFDALLIVAMVLIVFVLGRGGLRSAVEESTAKYELGTMLAEYFRPGFALRDAPARAYVREHLDGLAARYLQRRSLHFKVVLKQFMGALMTQALASAGLLGLGGYLVIARELTLGQLVAAEIIVATVVSALSDLGKHLETYYDLTASLYKLDGLLELPEERSAEPDDGEVLASGPAAVSLQDVFLSVNGRPLLSGVALDLAPGEKLTLIGPPESGKSSLLSLLFGARRPDQGQVRIDGIDVRELSSEQLRRRVVVVRGPEILPGTVLDNVRLGHPDLTPARIRKLLGELGLLDELGRLPEGLETMLGPSGVQLSPSQALRLTLARAMARGPGLLAIDTDLSAVHSRSMAHVASVLAREDAPWTLLVVGEHPQLSPICSRIVRLDKGLIHHEEAA